MIPKIIHQIWTDANIPPRFEQYRASWLLFHPDWQYILWTDADVIRFIAQKEPELHPLYLGHLRPICRSDMARYCILKHYGGLYVDLDFECLRPMEPLLAGTSLAIGIEPASHLATEAVRRSGLSRILCPSLIASTPGHALWASVADALCDARDEPDVLDATGPFLLTRSFDALERRGDAGDARLLPASSVYPVDKFDCWDGKLFDILTWERTTRDAYAIHYWDGGWFRAPAKRQFPRAFGGKVTGPHPPKTVGQRGPHAMGAPLVSCLMVTRDRPAQARLALACFRAQTYVNRELVVVDDGTSGDLAGAAAGDPRIRIVKPNDPVPNLGRARNRAVAEARGDYVCQWDDDDLCDPARLEIQMSALRFSGAQACLLTQWLIWWPKTGRIAVSRRRSWEGSVLCERASLGRYPEIVRGEDSPVVQDLIRTQRVVHLDAPRLYLYIVHGRNAFEPDHFEEHWTRAEARFTGERYRAVLSEIGKRVPCRAYLDAL